MEQAVTFAGRLKLKSTENSREVVVNSASEQYYKFSSLSASSGVMPRIDSEVAVSSDYAILIGIEDSDLLILSPGVRIDARSSNGPGRKTYR